MAKLKNLLQISDNVNKNLDRITDRKVVNKLDSIVPPIFTPVVKEFNDVPKEVQNKPPPICDTQPKIEYDSEDFTYHSDIDSDEEQDDDIVEFKTLIFPEVTIITELVDLFPNDMTCNGIRHTHLTYLSIISTAFLQIGYKNCKVIVDNESFTNAVFFELFKNNGLKSLPHSHPFRVPWIKSTIIRVQQSCLVTVNFHLYLWRIMWHMLGIKSKFSTTFQLPTDCQTDVHETALSSFT